MKNRRLNVLFIALIALAAAPQALQDAHSLFNAAHDRAESEFWSIFLSYQTPEGNGTGRGGARGLVAARSLQETKEACPLQRIREQGEVARSSRSNASAPARARSSAEVIRATAKAETNATETAEPNLNNDEEVASNFVVRPVVFTEKEQKALTAPGLHAREAGRVADTPAKAAFAYYFNENENVQIKVRKLMELDKTLRQRNRSNRDREEADDEPPSPNPIGM